MAGGMMFDVYEKLVHNDTHFLLNKMLIQFLKMHEYKLSSKRSIKILAISLIITLCSVGGSYAQIGAEQINAFKKKQFSSLLAPNRKHMNININNLKFSDALYRISNKASVGISFSPDIIPAYKVSLHLKNVSVYQALYKLLSGTGLQVVLPKTKDVLVIQKKTQNLGLKNKQETVSGTITDAQTGDTLPGVNVILKGTTTGTSTNATGHYSLNVPSLQDTLVFSFIGYEKKTVPIDGHRKINIELTPKTISGKSLVVVGYVKLKEKNLTGSNVQVSGNKIEKLNTVSTLDALQGSTPGVQLTKTNGQPGSGYKVNIHGMGTIGNSNPLYIVDGVVVGNIDNLSPSDIQNVSVLKGPMAAIYGSRAANGVILITTKHGQKSQKPTITYNTYYGWQNVYKTANLLDAQQYLTVINEGMVDAGKKPYDITTMAHSLNGNNNNKLVPLVPDASSILAGNDEGTDWMNAITNSDAPIQSHAVNISGGSDRTTYSLGLSFKSQDGILGEPVASHYDRYNVLINSDHTILTDENERSLWKVGEHITYSFNQRNGIAVGNGYWNDIYDMESANPFLPIYGAKGLYSYKIPWDHLQNNPIATMVNSRGLNKSKNHNLTASFHTTISPIKNLEFTSRFSTNVSAGSYRSFTPTYNLGSVYDATTVVGNSKNSTTQNMNVGLNWIWENTLSYEFTVQGDHNFKVLAGQSAEKDGLGQSLGGTNTNNIFNQFKYAYLSNTPTISSSGGTTISGSPWGRGGILSYFGRLNYNYKQKYLLSAVVRADGSSNFAQGHRWGTFPAFSAGWIITREPFLNSSWLDFLKIRASWGKNGNQSIPNFQYLSTIQTGGNAFYTYGDKTEQSPGAYPNILPNPGITWETSTQADVGLDAHFLHSRLKLSFDLYNKETDGWLVQVPVPAVAGTNPPYVNGGNIRNRGYDIKVGWSDQIGQFHYSISGNASYNQNRVTKIKGGGTIYGASGFYGNNSSWYVAKEGQAAGSFYGYKTDGIFQTQAQIQAYKNKKGQLIQPNARPGDIHFIDLNGDGKIGPDDRTEIGLARPPYNFGVSVDLAYKGFDFTFLGTGVAGNKIVQATDWNSLNDPLANYTTGILNRWHGPGTSNSMPRISLNGNASNNNFSDMWLQPGDYFRIQNLTLGYDFKHVWQDMPVQKARLYVTIQNAYTFTKYRGMDPAIGYAPDSWSQGIDLGYYPSPRTVMFGAELKF